MTDHSRFVGHVRDLTITPGPPPPEEPRVNTASLRLQEQRHRAGLTQTEVADAVGVSPAHIASLENRDDGRLSLVVSYIQAIGGSVEFVTAEHRTTLEYTVAS